MKLLFLCTGNSCRSQMAEAFANHWATTHAPQLVAYSAGIEKHGMNPHVATVMAEVGIDMSCHSSKTVEELLATQDGFDVVVTVCGHAHETCPHLPGNHAIVHAGFPDPPALARAAQATGEEDPLPHYRHVRDLIQAWVETQLATELRTIRASRA